MKQSSIAKVIKQRWSVCTDLRSDILCLSLSLCLSECLTRYVSSYYQNLSGPRPHANATHPNDTNLHPKKRRLSSRRPKTSIQFQNSKAMLKKKDRVVRLTARTLAQDEPLPMLLSCTLCPNAKPPSCPRFCYAMPAKKRPKMPPVVGYPSRENTMIKNK